MIIDTNNGYIISYKDIFCKTFVEMWILYLFSMGLWEKLFDIKFKRQLKFK